MYLSNRNQEDDNYSSIADYLRVSEVKGGDDSKKTKFEYQELCKELEPIYGKAIWAMVYKPGFTEYKIRKAHEIAKDRNILEFKYLVGIIKKL